MTPLLQIHENPYAAVLFVDNGVEDPPLLVVTDEDEPVLIIPVETVTLEVSQVGVQGPTGARGERGVLRHEHIQTSPSARWIVNHNFGYRPNNVRVLSTGGVEVEAGVLDISDNQLHIEFAIPFVGKAIIL